MNWLLLSGEGIMLLVAMYLCSKTALHYITLALLSVCIAKHLFRQQDLRFVQRKACLVVPKQNINASVLRGKKNEGKTLFPKVRSEWMCQ